VIEQPGGRVGVAATDLRQEFFNEGIHGGGGSCNERDGHLSL
jgi:hypothetical protein